MVLGSFSHYEMILESILSPYGGIYSWFNDCRKNCPGCMAKFLKEVKPYTDISVQLDEMLNQAIAVTGSNPFAIIVSGGEPLLQPQAIIYLRNEIDKLNSLYGTDLFLQVYTGYNEDELEGYDRTVLNCIDILIAGEYDEEKDDGFMPVVGSTNQKLVFATGREDLDEAYKRFMSTQCRKKITVYNNQLKRFITVGV